MFVYFNVSGKANLVRIYAEESMRSRITVAELSVALRLYLERDCAGFLPKPHQLKNLLKKNMEVDIDLLTSKILEAFSLFGCTDGSRAITWIESELCTDSARIAKSVIGSNFYYLAQQDRFKLEQSIRRAIDSVPDDERLRAVNKTNLLGGGNGVEK